MIYKTLRIALELTLTGGRAKVVVLLGKHNMVAGLLRIDPHPANRIFLAALCRKNLF